MAEITAALNAVRGKPLSKTSSTRSHLIESVLAEVTKWDWEQVTSEELREEADYWKTDGKVKIGGSHE